MRKAKHLTYPSTSESYSLMMVFINDYSTAPALKTAHRNYFAGVKGNHSSPYFGPNKATQLTKNIYEASKTYSKHLGRDRG